LEQSTSEAGTLGSWNMAKDMITATLLPQTTKVEIVDEVEDLIRSTFLHQGMEMQPDLISLQELDQVMDSLCTIQADLWSQWDEYKRTGLGKAWRDSHKHEKVKTGTSNTTV